MSTLVLMRILESSPSRYDKGINLILGKKLYSAFDRILTRIKENDNVLDIGSGTGILSIMIAQKGAKVKGIDINTGMLEIARSRIQDEGFSKNITFEEKGVAELDSEVEESYDIITSTLCFSELEDFEITYSLKQINRILKPEGLFLLVDEIKPKNPLKRFISNLIRIPLVMITYLLTQNSTSRLHDIEKNIKANNFKILDTKTNWLGSFIELICEKS